VHKPNRKARPTANTTRVLERYKAVLLVRLERRSGELRQTRAELQEAHEQILELNQTLETRVEQRTAALDSANQELEAFSCSVAHDLSGPLLNIIGYADLLEETTGVTLDSAGREYLSRIATGARGMNQLIGALLEFGRLGCEPLKLTTVDLEEVLEEALAIVSLESEGRSIQWQRQRLPRVKGDPTLLRQVFVNLIDNALKYTRARDPAVIEIGWRGGRADEVVISIRDNGIGFDMQHANTLFGVFQRLEGADPFEGTGIGLANARRIVSRHGGHIWAQAEVGRGATFCFSLLRADFRVGSSTGT
jgi:signal transduction histidine kinase